MPAKTPNHIKYFVRNLMSQSDVVENIETEVFQFLKTSFYEKLGRIHQYSVVTYNQNGKYYMDIVIKSTRRPYLKLKAIPYQENMIESALTIMKDSLG